jgi:hypothetical protein
MNQSQEIYWSKWKERDYKYLKKEPIRKNLINFLSKSDRKTILILNFLIL